MTLAELNALPARAAARELLACCGSTRWADALAAERPFATLDALLRRADEIWWSLDGDDWREAFAAHPRIGESSPPRSREASGADRAGSGRGDLAWSAGEQAGMASADDWMRHRLAQGNRDYEARFGYIFIVCATGKSGAEMLEALDQRLRNRAEAEVRVAADEQRKITRIRLTKLLA